jgi:hypothetical protein
MSVRGLMRLAAVDPAGAVPSRPPRMMRGLAAGRREPHRGCFVHVNLTPAKARLRCVRSDAARLRLSNPEPKRKPRG